MTITLNDEQARLLSEVVNAGVAHSPEEAVDKAVRALHSATTGKGLVQQPAEELPIWEILAGSLKDLPPEELAALPRDGAGQVDHYVYGLPKRAQ